jgi:prepilin-type N-terminal cleavage/methylation domain-containing protein
MKRRATRFVQSGVSLVEVLVAMVIVAIGLLSLVVLHGRLHVLQAESYQRSQALIILNDMASRIQLNRNAAARELLLRRAGGMSMFGVLGWIIFGLIVGAVAKLLMPGRDPGGIIVTMLLGIVGAVVGGFLGRMLGFYGPNEAAGFFMSLLGAVALLAIYRMATRRRAALP